LACAVLICLIGVMFESGRFNLNRPDLAGQQQFFDLGGDHHCLWVHHLLRHCLLW